MKGFGLDDPKDYPPLVDYWTMCHCQIKGFKGIVGNPLWMQKGGLLSSIRTDFGILTVNFGFMDSWKDSIKDFWTWIGSLGYKCRCGFRIPRRSVQIKAHGNPNWKDYNTFCALKLEKGSKWIWKDTTSHRNVHVRKLYNRTGSFIFGRGRPQRPIRPRRSILDYLKQRGCKVKPYLLQFTRLMKIGLCCGRGDYQEQGISSALSAATPEGRQDMKEISDNLRLAAHNFNDAVLKVGPILNKLQGSFFTPLEGFAETSRKALDMMQGDDGTFLRAFDKVANNGIEVSTAPCKMSAWETIVMLGSSLYLFCTFTDWSQSVALVANQFAACGLGSKMMEWVQGNRIPIQDLQAGFSRAQQDYDQQSTDYSSLVAPLSHLLSTGIATIMSTSDDRPMPRYQKTAIAAQSLNQINSLSGVCEASLKVASERLWEIWTGLPHGVKTMDDFTVEVEAWLESVSLTVSDLKWMADLTMNFEKQEIVGKLVTSGQSLLKMVRTMHSDVRNKLTFPITMSLRSLEKAKAVIAMLGSPLCERSEPVSIILRGGTGVGKTTMVKQLGIDLLRRLPESERSKYSKNKFIFSKDRTTEYYDGYDGHFIFFIDELFQSTESQDEVADSMTLIHLVNSHTAPLNMATMELKNKVSFNSPFIIATTNAHNWDNMPVRSAQALKRRRGVIIEPVVKAQFCKTSLNHEKELDGRKWTEYANNNKILKSQPRFATFNIFDSDTDTIVKKDIEYAELIDYIHNVYNMKRTTFNDLNECQDKDLEAALKGLSYEPQADTDDNTVMSLLKNIRKQKDYRSSSYLYKCEMPKALLLSQLKWNEGFKWENIERDTFDKNLESQLPAVKKWATLWETLSLERKVEATIMICMMANTDRDSVRRAIYKATFSVDDDMLDALGTGNLYDRLVVAGDKFNHPIHDWRCKAKSILQSFRSKFPWKEVVQAFTVIAMIVGAVWGIYTIAKKTKKKNHTIGESVSKEESFKGKTTNRAKFFGRNRTKFSREEATDDTPDAESESGFVEQQHQDHIVDYHTKGLRVVEESERDIETVNGIHTGKVSRILPSYQEESIVDNNWEDGIKHKVLGNCCVVTLNSFGTRLSQARGLMVKSDFIIVPCHFLQMCREPMNTTLNIVKAGGSYNIGMDLIQSVSIGEKWHYNDVALVKLPQNKINASDIVKFFATEKDITQIVDTFGELLVPDQDVITRHATHIIAQEEYVRMDPKVITLVSPEDQRYAVTGWHYLASTKKGDCGSPLIRWDPSARTKIIGIHAAGNNSSKKDVGCFATIVDQEFLVEGIAKLGGGVYVQQSDVGRPFFGNSHLLKDSMELICYVDRKDASHMPTSKTKIQPSLFQGVLAEPRSHPAIASIEVGGSLDKVLRKFQRDTPYVDKRLVDNIAKVLYFKSPLSDKSNSRELLGWNEAIKGLDDFGCVNPQSSMGYPFSNQGLKKTDVLELQPDGYVLKEETEFFKNLLSTEQLILGGQAPEWIWATYMKDERLPKEKALNGKIRLFMACPFDLTLLCRKYFGNFLNVIHDKRLQIGCLVGVDPHSTEWNTIAMKLLNYNSLICTEDFSNWDRSVPKEFLETFFTWAKLYYGAGYTKAHEVLEFSILCPTYQTGYFRYRVPSSNPSGSPFTSEMNSISNIIITIYCLVKAGHELSQILNDTQIFTYGDDKVWTAKFDFDMSTYVKELTNLGLTVTSPKKDGSLPELLPIGEIDFLQRKFGLVYGIYRGQLKIPIIIESLLWVGGHINHRDALEETVRSAFVELQQYLPVEVGGLYSRILTCCKKYNVAFPITEHLINSMLGNEESWSGTNLEEFLLRLGGSFWNQSLSYDKIPVTAYSLQKIKGKRVYYVGIDIVQDFPVITKDIFYHTGFRFEGFNFELVFSDKGVVWVPALYTPQFKYEVKMNYKNFISSLVINKSYHRVRWNCIAWAEWVMVSNRIQPPVLLHHKLVNFINLYYPDMMLQQQSLDYEVQADNGTLSENVTSYGEDTGNFTRGVFSNTTPTFAPAPTRDFHSLLETDELIGEGFWRDDNRMDEELITIDLPGKLLEVKQFKQKLAFNALFSANMVVKLKVSSTPFQCGQLLLVWEPLGQYGMPGGVPLHTFACTAMPSVLLNASTQKEVSLTIPFISPFNFVRLNECPKLGYLRLRVLNELRDNSSYKKASFSVYGYFTNVTVMAPTPISEGSGSGMGTDVYPSFKSQSDEATDKTKMGIISGVTSKIATVAELVGRIPIFRTVAGTVASVAHIATDIATFMGLSKPNSLSATVPVIPRPLTAVSYADGLDMSLIIGTSSRNHVVIQPSLFGSLVDEMSIQYIVKTPQVIDTFEWHRFHSADSILRTFPVVPTLGGKITGKDLNIKYCQLSPMGYVAICSKYWRGSMQFRVQCISTSFHQGRLAIGFVPIGVQANFDLSTTSHVKFDLGIDTSVEFTVPFVSDRMYNRVPNVFDTIKLSEPVASGILVIKVLNPLVCPDTVSNKISLNVWVSGGSDMEFAVPTLDQVRLYDYGYTDKTVSVSVGDDFDLLKDALGELEEGEQDLVEQGDVIDTGRTRDQAQLGTDAEPLQGFQNCACEGVNGIVMGEYIHSLRDILKIFVKKFETKTKAQERQLCYNIPSHSYLTDLEELRDTYYDHLTRMYRMSRGSVRQKLIFPKISGKVSVILNVDSKEDPFTWYASEDVTEGSPWGACVPSINPTIEYMVPFYSKEKFQIHGSATGSRSVTVAIKCMSFKKDAEIKIFGYESIGDDFSMGYLTGPPCIFEKPPSANLLPRLLYDAFIHGHEVKDDKIDGIEKYQVKPSGYESYISWETHKTLAPNIGRQHVQDTSKTQDYMLNITDKTDRLSTLNVHLLTLDSDLPNCKFAFLLFRDYTKQTGTSDYIEWGSGKKENFQGVWMMMKVHDGQCVIDIIGPGSGNYANPYVTGLRKNYGLPIVRAMNSSIGRLKAKILS